MRIELPKIWKGEKCQSKKQKKWKVSVQHFKNWTIKKKGDEFMLKIETLKSCKVEKGKNVKSWKVEHVEKLKSWKSEKLKSRNVEKLKCWKFNVYERTLSRIPCSRAKPYSHHQSQPRRANLALHDHNMKPPLWPHLEVATETTFKGHVNLLTKTNNPGFSSRVRGWKSSVIFARH